MTSALPPDPAASRQPQPPDDRELSPETEHVNPGRQLRVSYGLWCLAFVGLCGLHRLYNRKPLTGFLWLLTFGLCGVGQLADLALMPKMVTSVASAGEGEGESKSKSEAESEGKGKGDTERKSIKQAPPTTPTRVSRALPPLDLLRERRLQLDRQPLSGVLELRPGLIRRGLLIGGLLLGGALGANAMLFVFHQSLRNRELELRGFEQEAVLMRDSIQRDGTRLQAMRGANQQLVERLSDVRSSSALLADLQLRVPEGVQITKVQMLSPTLIQLEGLARDPVGFGRVNAMELMLRRSPLFQASGVTIDKVERVPAKEFDIRPSEGAAAGGAVKSTKVTLPSAVIFKMKATLSPLPPNRLVAVMESLKAEGMVRRLELLQQEGLLK